jgi:hypothetical protein
MTHPAAVRAARKLFSYGTDETGVVQAASVIDTEIGLSELVEAVKRVTECSALTARPNPSCRCLEELRQALRRVKEKR